MLFRTVRTLFCTGGTVPDTGTDTVPYLTGHSEVILSQDEPPAGIIRQDFSLSPFRLSCHTMASECGCLHLEFISRTGQNIAPKKWLIEVNQARASLAFQPPSSIIWTMLTVDTTTRRTFTVLIDRIINYLSLFFHAQWKATAKITEAKTKFETR